jgi:hypothetical protein
VTGLPPAEALQRVADEVGATPSGHLVETDVGSPLAMRLWGAFTPAEKVPLRVRIETAEVGGDTRVTIEATSRQGWYAGQVRGLAARVFDRGFASIFARLREAAPPGS